MVRLDQAGTSVRGFGAVVFVGREAADVDADFDAAATVAKLRVTGQRRTFTIQFPTADASNAILRLA